MGINITPGMRLLIWATSLGLLVVYLSSQLRVVNDIGQFMPAAHQNPQLQALMSEIQNGPTATALMLRISSAETTELAKLSTELSQSLNTQNQVFRNARNSNTPIEISSTDTLFRYRYLLSEELDWSQPALKKNFEQRLIELRFGASPLLDEFLTSDPQMAFMKYLGGLSDITGPVVKHGVWFDKEGETALMLVRVQGNSLDLDIMQQAEKEIRLSFSKLTLALSSSAQLEIAGPGIMAVKTRATIEQVVTRLSVFMAILLVIVFILAYRNLHLLLLAGIPLLSAIVVALTVTQLIFDEVHGIVLAFGITLLGVCLDYPLHLFSHLRAGEQSSTSLNRIWPTLFLSGASSVLAYLALLGSGFNGLDQLAAFAACGLTAALVVTRYLLPYWVSPDRVRPRLWALRMTLGSAQRKGLAILLLGLPMLLIVRADVVWETSIDAISPVPASLRASDRELRHDLNAPEVSHVFLLSGDDIESVLQASEYVGQQLIDLKQQGIISSIWSPSRILPSAQQQGQRRDSLPTAQQLTNDMEAALSDIPFRPEAFTPWIESVTASYHLDPLDYDTVISTPLADILQHGLFKQGDLWISTIRISGIRSNAELYSWLDLHPEVKNSHVEIKRATEQLLTEYRLSTFERFLIVIALLAIIILLWSGNLRRTLRILLPVSIGVLSGFSVPLLAGAAINVFHLLALLLVVGMGLDYSLFINRTGGDQLDRRQSFHAISISALTTSAAFAVLAFSSVPVMAAMGQTVATGVIMCFLSTGLLTGSTDESLAENIK